MSARTKLTQSRHKYCVFLLIASLTLMACSSDTLIVSDYKLFDLDGSNQAIIGAEGAVSVSDITAYDVDGSVILFETGTLGLIDQGGTETLTAGPCNYGYIDTKKSMAVPAAAGSSLHRFIRARLAASRKGVVSRSCVARVEALRVGYDGNRQGV